MAEYIINKKQAKKLLGVREDIPLTKENLIPYLRGENLREYFDKARDVFLRNGNISEENLTIKSAFDSILSELINEYGDRIEETPTPTPEPVKPEEEPSIPEAKIDEPIPEEPAEKPIHKRRGPETRKTSTKREANDDKPTHRRRLLGKKDVDKYAGKDYKCLMKDILLESIMDLYSIAEKDPSFVMPDLTKIFLEELALGSEKSDKLTLLLKVKEKLSEALIKNDKTREEALKSYNKYNKEMVKAFGFGLDGEKAVEELRTESTGVRMETTPPAPPKAVISIEDKYKEICQRDDDNLRLRLDPIIGNESSFSSISNTRRDIYEKRFDDSPEKMAEFKEHMAILMQYTKLKKELDAINLEIDSATSNILREEAKNRFASKFKEFSDFSSKRTPEGRMQRDVALELDGDLKALSLSEKMQVLSRKGEVRTFKAVHELDIFDTGNEETDGKNKRDYEQFMQDYNKALKAKNDLARARIEKTGLARATKQKIKDKEQEVKLKSKEVRMLDRSLASCSTNMFSDKHCRDYEDQLRNMSYMVAAGCFDRNYDSKKLSVIPRRHTPKLDIDMETYAEVLYGYDQRLGITKEKIEEINKARIERTRSSRDVDDER